MKPKIVAIIVTATMVLSLLIAVMGAVGQAVSDDSVGAGFNLAPTRAQFGDPVADASDGEPDPSDNAVYSAFKKVCPLH